MLWVGVRTVVCMWEQQGLLVISGLNYTTEQTGHSWVKRASVAVKSVAVLPCDMRNCALANLRTEKFLYHYVPLPVICFLLNLFCDVYILCLNGRKGVALILIFETLVSFWRWDWADIKTLDPWKEAAAEFGQVLLAPQKSTWKLSFFSLSRVTTYISGPAVVI